MRPSCLECAGKHLAQACVLLKEVKTGYPAFKWFVLGHLAEAEEETVRDHPAFANEIREHRVAWFVDDTVVIPFEDLLGKIDELLEAEGSSANEAVPTSTVFGIGETVRVGRVADMPQEGDLGSVPLP